MREPELMHAVWRHEIDKRNWNIEPEADPEWGKGRTNTSTGEAMRGSAAGARDLPVLVNPIRFSPGMMNRVN